MLKKVWKYLGKYRIFIVLSIIFILGEAVLDVFIPRFMSKIIDVGIQNKDIPFIFETGIKMLAVALSALICGVLAARFSAVGVVGFSANIRQALYEKIQTYSFANINKFTPPSLITRLTTDVTNIQMAFMMFARAMFRSSTILVFATLMTVTINPRLSLIFIAVIIVLSLGFVFISRSAFPRFQKMLKAIDKINAVSQENLIAIRTVKSFVREKYENEKYQDASDTLRAAQFTAEKLMALSMPGMQFVMYSCILAILWFGGNMIIGGTLLTGDLISFFTYGSQILIALMVLSMVLITLVISRASISRISEALNEIPDVDNPENPVLTVDNGSIEFKNVSFKYSDGNGEDVLSDINFKINSGETVGILGGTGSAKTSLVQLIPRLYDVSGGTVLVGGRDVREYDIHSLRDAVSMVLQVNTLFSGTIAENIRWGNKDASDEQVVEACRAAQAHDFITAMPDGYNSVVEQGGVNFSGGQKQRLCIARAILKKPKILILDDSTSAVDTMTDLKIREAFKTIIKDTTTIIIAQRISSISSADKIIVMNDGKIEDIGTHDELLSRNNTYIEVFNSQQKGDAE